MACRFPDPTFTILNTLLLYPEMVTPGLLNSTIYDVIPILPGASGEVQVNASTYQADCGLISNVSFGPGNFNTSNGIDDNNYGYWSALVGGSAALGQVDISIGMLHFRSLWKY